MPDWFVINVADARGFKNAKAGVWTKFEPPDARFQQLGVNITVVWPGQPSSAYHGESNQEDFLVLFGECVAIVEDQERLLRQWDFLHCPPMTRHTFVGAGDGPCAILMVGTRDPDEVIEYPASDVAARYGAAATTPTASPEEAYSDWPEDVPLDRVPWPPPGEPPD